MEWLPDWDSDGPADAIFLNVDQDGVPAIWADQGGSDSAAKDG